MARIPIEGKLDSTFALRRDPYGFIADRCRSMGTDAFETRILLRRTICMTGPAAAELFYDERRFVRQGAAPLRLQETLFGREGVQTLDGAAHRHRKAMFLSIMSRENIRRLVNLAGDAWDWKIGHWTRRDYVVLYPEVREMLARAACAWSGVPLPERDVVRRTRELTALFEGAGSVGPAHWWSRRSRNSAERWARRLVNDVRSDRHPVPKGSPLRIIAEHRGEDGRLLRSQVAAVELLNLLRPSVAVAVYIVFVAHALHFHPAWRRQLLEGGEVERECFVQEVRRLYPFFPSVLARTRVEFEWRDLQFPKGRRTILDLYGTNHDPRVWTEPKTFRPDRFRDWKGSPFVLIPQGGGDHGRHHRCPGEWITIELMKQAVEILSRRIGYDVPDQDLRIDLTRLPAMMHSGFVIASVHARKPPSGCN
jgi:fatty-acid peroxygenase